MKSKITESKQPTCVVPNGCLVVIGGAEDKSGSQDGKPGEKLNAGQSVLEEFIRCCGTKAPRIELITTAGEEDIEGTFREYESVFKKLGASHVGHIHHNRRDEIDDEDLAPRIAAANGVFFAGGDQLRVTSLYGGTPFLTNLKEAYLFKKLIVGGTSAGAMVLSTPMIFGGTGQQEMVAAAVKIGTGFEFLKDVCIDTHFVHRGRFVRMAQVVATNPASIGIGIEEDTAIIVRNGVDATVCGSGVVIIIDGCRINSSNIAEFNDEKKISIRDLNVSILAAGEKFTIPQRNPPHQ